MKTTGLRYWASALLAIAALGGAGDLHAVEEIFDFSSHIAVAANGDITVTETVTVNAEGRQIRRGIYRDLSTQYQDASGSPIDVPMTLLGAQRDGETIPYRTEQQESGDLRVYLGDADVVMEPGRYVFELVYRTRGQIRTVKGFDTLSWNSTGGWELPIRNAHCTVRLPAPVGEAALHTAAYVGTHDARRKDYTVEFPEPGVVRFKATSPLAAGEGLVVAVVFPADLVE